MYKLIILYHTENPRVDIFDFKTYAGAYAAQLAIQPNFKGTIIKDYEPDPVVDPTKK